MREILQYQINSLRSTWHNGLSGEALRSSIAFPVLVVLAFALCMAFPTLRDSLLSTVLSSTENTGAINEDGTLSAILPHGLLELPALIISFAVGLFVCGQVTRRLFRKDESALHVWDCLVLISRVLLLVLIPLLAAAALIEAYITSVIASLFI